jgi:hypothetical protein
MKIMYLLFWSKFESYIFLGKKSYIENNHLTNHMDIIIRNIYYFQA